MINNLPGYLKNLIYFFHPKDIYNFFVAQSIRKRGINLSAPDQVKISYAGMLPKKTKLAYSGRVKLLRMCLAR